ncbi:MMPL family transporter [Herminiimonas sp. CN]|uniref:MMPL family transporter n=1 Tax=Herminiimonas sp. CN TaxID=1349818 RepID=UPI00047353E7|nr:MMPL family transporter [Herminiimonas sp. CN]
MKRLQSRRMALAAWLLGLAMCCVVIARTTFITDLSGFLPQSPTKEQRVLLDQLREGVVSRLILIGIEGGDAALRAALSKETAKRLRAAPAFVTVNNGEPLNAERDQAFLFDNRYLLSPAVTPDRFSVAGLHAAIGDTIDLLVSPAGLLIKPLLPRDPTGEIVQLLGQMNGANQPRMQYGTWASHDAARALLLVQTRAAGADTDAQEHAMQQIRQAFEAARRQHGASGAAVKLAMTGPGVFSVLSRQTIKSEVTRLSVISTAIIVALLWLVYRSLTALALGLLPVISGALVAVVAVSLGFGAVHGITLGFGTTLIGEAVDYSIYLFVQSRQSSAEGSSARLDWVADFWPTIRLGVLTSVTGFASLLLSSFPGLAQLGLYSIAGLIAAAAVTRFVLPQLLHDNFRIRDVSAIGCGLSGAARRASALRWPLILLILAAAGVVVLHRTTLWNPELSSLSPVSQADQATDAGLRADMGAPDVRYMVVLSGAEREAVLQSTEKIAEQLQPLVDQGILAGFQSPSQFLPSVAAQRARQASLPAAQLAQRLQQATIGLPVRPELFAPFVADVAKAKNRAPLQRSDLDHTSLALALDSLLYQRGSSWNAVLPLTASASGQSAGIATAPVRAALALAGQPNALLVDLKAESDHLYQGYLREAVMLSLAGLAGIVLLLLFSLRSPLAVIRVMAPLLGAIVVVVAGLALCGQRLTILHLVGLLLIVAVGSNYALFFNQPGRGAAGITPQTLTSLVFANLTTVAGFGLLGFSTVPVLQAIGSTVGPGAVLALIFSAVFASQKIAGRQPEKQPGSAR